jgi:hypothetical protein
VGGSKTVFLPYSVFSTVQKSVDKVGLVGWMDVKPGFKIDYSKQKFLLYIYQILLNNMFFSNLILQHVIFQFQLSKNKKLLSA